LIENIDSLSFFICIVIVATSHILTCQYSNLTKFADIYISCLLVLQVSIYFSFKKITVKDIITEIIAIIIYAVIIKFFNRKKLNELFDKCNMWIIFFIYLIVLTTQNVYVLSAFSILLMLKYYYTLKKDNILKQNNYEVIIAVIFFSMFNLEYSIWFLIAYDFRINIKSLKIEIEDL